MAKGLGRKKKLGGQLGKTLVADAGSVAPFDYAVSVQDCLTAHPFVVHSKRRSPHPICDP
jgi:hypothetical protein